jgi:type IV pilus assembly protein PilE
VIPLPARARGFTLMELMIAVAIVAILATIALPSYRQYVLRANRTVAKAALSEVVSRQASYYSEAKRYALKFSKIGWAQDDTLYLDREGNLRETRAADSIYSVSLKGGATASTCPASGSPSAGAYTVVATPINAQADDTKCGAMCLSSVGIKSAGGSDAEDCWKR